MCAFHVRKKDTNELTYKMETGSQTQRSNLVVTSKEVRGERDELGFGIYRYCCVLKSG